MSKKDEKTQATIPEAMGDPHFAMERGSYDNTVMEKIRNCNLNLRLLSRCICTWRETETLIKGRFMAVL